MRSSTVALLVSWASAWLVFLNPHYIICCSIMWAATLICRAIEARNEGEGA